MAVPSAQSDCVCDQCLSQTAAGWLPALMAITQSDGWRDGQRGRWGENAKGTRKEEWRNVAQTKEGTVD